MDELHDPTPAVPYPNLLMVPQWRTSALLAEGLPIELGVGVTELTQDETGVRVTLDTGEILTPRYVVGADGGRSTVRRQLGVGFEGETHESEQLLIADVRLSGLDRDGWHVWPGADGRSLRLGLCPLPGTDDFQLTARPPRMSIEELIASVDPAITVTQVGWTSHFRANMRHGRPLPGRQRLPRRRRRPRALPGRRPGPEHRHPGRLQPGLEARHGRRRAARHLRGRAAAGGRRRARHQHRACTAGTSTGTRTRCAATTRCCASCRSTTAAARSPPSTARLPARSGPATARRTRPPADGRVFDLLRGPHATLLAFNWPGDLPSGPADLPAHRISDPATAEIYDVREPTLFLVRPDNYIGCATTDPADVLTYRKLIGV